MKILYLFNSGDLGGMEKHVVDLTRGMSLLGHDVYVWCPRGPIQTLLDDAGAKVYTEPIKWDIDPRFISGLVEFLKLEKIEVIHAHELKAVVNGLIASMIVGTEVKVSHTHTPITEWRIGLIKKSINIFLNSFLINVSKSTEIALTETRKQVKKKEGTREKYLTVIPNAIDISRFDFTYNKKKEFNKEIRTRYKIPMKAHVIGNVSRMTKEKGHEYLVEAFAKLSKKNKDLYLLLAGGGKLHNDIHKQIDDLGISDKCVMTGIFADEDLPKLYSTFDTFVFPTLAEGFGYVLIEAMYSQVPVLCSDLPVLQEVGAKTVSYFKTKDVDSLVRKLTKMLKEPKRYRDFSKEARERVEKEYSMEKFYENYDQLYNDLMDSYQKSKERKTK